MIKLKTVEDKDEEEVSETITEGRRTMLIKRGQDDEEVDKIITNEAVRRMKTTTLTQVLSFLSLCYSTNPVHVIWERKQ